MKRLLVRSAVGLAALALVGCSNTASSKQKETPRAAAPPAATSTVPSAATPPLAPAAAVVVGPKRRYVVAALGDSITDSRVGGGGYLRVLRERCPHSEFLDFGKGGDMTNQMRRRFEADIVPLAQTGVLTTLLLYGGVNDLYSDLTAGRTNDRIEAELLGIYEHARELKLEVVAMTVSPWGGFTRYFNARRSDNTRLLNSWILGQVAQKTVDRAVDSYPWLSCGDPEKLCPEYENRGHDGLHPGPEGHARLGQALFEGAFRDCE